MKARLALIGLALFMLFSGKTAASDADLLRIEGRSVVVTNKTPLRLTGPENFKMVGPMQFEKDEENGWVFDVSVVSYVAPNAVLSVTAERLQRPPDARLNYADLPASDWPGDGFRTLSNTCMNMTREIAASLPENSGIQEIVAAGFEPEGDFAVASAIASSADGRDEVSIEIIKRVASCNDEAVVAQAIKAMRDRLKVELSE